VSIEIRPVTRDDDLGAELDLAVRAFGPSSAADRQVRLDRIGRAVADGRILGVFDGSQMVASAYYHQMRQWWRGRDLPMAGVASVKVAPEERGRGIGRALMTELLELAAANGNVVSALYPATAALYRSVGWELAGAHYELTVPTRTLRRLSDPDALLSGAAPDPAPVLRRPGPADASAVITVIDQVSAASRDCGPATCADFVQRELANPEVFRVLAPDGYLAYEWARAGTEILVRRLIAGTPASARALWDVIASHGTIADTVRAIVSPAGSLPWLTALPDVRWRTTFPWMLRVLSAAEAVTGRGYAPAVTLSVPLELADPQLPGNDGSWRLEITGGAGVLKPAPGPDPAALRLGPRGFAALYGGVPMTTLRQAGLATGGGPDADAGLDAAFGAGAYLLDEF
jgi:predicted acetyltransferase